MPPFFNFNSPQVDEINIITRLVDGGNGISHGCIYNNRLLIMSSAGFILIDDKFETTDRSIAAPVTPTAVATNGSRIIMSTVNTTNQILFSDDLGQSFVQRTLGPTAGNAFGIAINGNVVVVKKATGSPLLMVSNDTGNNWMDTGPTIATWGSNLPNKLKYIREMGYFYAIGGSGASAVISTSRDGFNWATVAINGASELSCMAYYNGHVYFFDLVGRCFRANGQNPVLSLTQIPSASNKPIGGTDNVRFYGACVHRETLYAAGVNANQPVIYKLVNNRFELVPANFIDSATNSGYLCESFAQEFYASANEKLMTTYSAS